MQCKEQGSLSFSVPQVKETSVNDNYNTHRGGGDGRVQRRGGNLEAESI